jgi:hypothetical protein
VCSLITEPGVSRISRTLRTAQAKAAITSRK